MSGHVTAKVAADALGVSLGRVYHYLTGRFSIPGRCGKLLSGRKVGGKYLIPTEALERFLKPSGKPGRKKVHR